MYTGELKDRTWYYPTEDTDWVETKNRGTRNLPAIVCFFTFNENGDIHYAINGVRSLAPKFMSLEELRTKILRPCTDEEAHQLYDFGRF